MSVPSPSRANLLGEAAVGGIRRATRFSQDRGVLLILDNRLASRASYAKQFLNSLPPGMQEYRLVERAEAVRLVEDWRVAGGGTQA